MKNMFFLLCIVTLIPTNKAAAQPDTLCGVYDGFHLVNAKSEYDYRGTLWYMLPTISSGTYTEGPPNNQTLLYNCFYHIDEITGNFINFAGVVSSDPANSAYGDPGFWNFGVGYDPTPVYRQVNFYCHQYYMCPDVNQHVPATNPNNPSNNWSSVSTWIDNTVPSPAAPTILLNKSTNLDISISQSGQLLISNTGSVIVEAGVVFTNPSALVRGNGLFQNNGTLKGNGNILGSVSNNGTISPGNNIGSFAIRDNYTATANAIHKIEIAGPNAYDTIKVGLALGTIGGVASLNGRLNVSLLNGFIPSFGNTYKIFTFNSSTGVFATNNLPLLPNGMGWKIHYNPTDITLEIVNLPSISISDKSVTEGNSGTTAMKFKVTLSEASSGHVYVNFATADSTATAPGDYIATSGTLKFNAGQTSKRITVFINGDTQKEKNEKLKLILSQPVNATIADGLGIGTIRNDDAAAFTMDGSAKKTQEVITNNSSIKVSPNPAKNQITVSGLSAGAANYIEITDLYGRSLLKQKVANTYHTLDVSKFANGTYILVYFDGNKMQQVKFIKE